MKLTKFEGEVDAVWPLYVGQHGTRLPPTERFQTMKVCQVTGRVSFTRVSLVANVARLGGARDARLLAEIFRTVESAGVGRLDREVKGGVDEGREAALRSTASVVARTLTGVTPGRRRMLPDDKRQQPAQNDGDQTPPTHLFLLQDNSHFGHRTQRARSSKNAPAEFRTKRLPDDAA